MIYQEDCRVIDNINVAPDYYKITFSSKEIAKEAKAGQFAQIKVSEGLSPLLRRPFSFHKIGKDSFEVLYHVVGSGSKILSQKKKGDILNIIGPLGNGFKVEKGKTAVLLAGGCGTAPLFALEEELKREGIESHFFQGASTDGLLLCKADFAKTGTKLYITTDDGSGGTKGTVSALFSSYLDSFDPKQSVIYTCGPKAMIRAVVNIAQEKNIECQVSLEEHMACGIGACLGCVVQTVNGNRRVCKDGPVFDSKEIIWQ